MPVYCFYQVELIPEDYSKLHQTMPKIKGAFVNCVVKANSQNEAFFKLQGALQMDGYIYLNHTGINIINEVDALRLEQAGVLDQFKDKGVDVIYSEFYCYE